MIEVNKRESDIVAAQIQKLLDHFVSEIGLAFGSLRFASLRQICLPDAT